MSGTLLLYRNTSSRRAVGRPEYAAGTVLYEGGTVWMITL